MKEEEEEEEETTGGTPMLPTCQNEWNGPLGIEGWEYWIDDRVSDWMPEVCVVRFIRRR